MLKKNIAVLVIAILAPYLSVDAALLGPVSPDDQDLIGGLSYVNFAAIWKDQVELLVLQSGNKSKSYICNRDMSNCREGQITKPDGTVSYNGDLLLETAYENEEFSFHKLTLDNSEGQLIPWFKKALPKISRDGEKVVLIGVDRLASYDIATNAVTEFKVDSFNDYSNILLSPSGNIITGYDSKENRFVIHHIPKNQTFYIATTNYKNQNYVEVSPDDNYVAIIDDLGSHDALSLYEFDKNKLTLNKILTERGETSDYIFTGEHLFYITNNKASYQWQLLAKNLETSEITVIADNVVTNGVLRVIDNNLVYRIQSGLGSALYTLDTTSLDLEKAPILAFESPENILEKELQYITFTKADDAINGVLLVNTDDYKSKSKPLVIWLHGGPQNQVRAGIHDSRTYGQYDQLLETLASQHEVRILKLDFPGSTGFGTEYTESLLGKVGIADIQAITTAIGVITDQYNTSDVHLIGISYGGYMALKTLVDYPKLVTNIIAISSATDWQNDFERDQTGGLSFITRLSESERTDQYEQANILNHVNRIDNKTNLALFVGSRDQVVKPQQSYDLIDAIDSAEVVINTAEIIEFKDEGHVISLLPNLRIIYGYMENWFTR